MMVQTFFEIEGPEFRFPEPVPCKHMERLTCHGIRLDDGLRVHGIFELRGDERTQRFYVGPSQDTVQRRAEILAVALQQAGAHPVAGLYAREWVEWTWLQCTEFVAGAESDALMEELGL